LNAPQFLWGSLLFNSAFFAAPEIKTSPPREQLPKRLRIRPTTLSLGKMLFLFSGLYLSFSSAAAFFQFPSFFLSGPFPPLCLPKLFSSQPTFFNLVPQSPAERFPFGQRIGFVLDPLTDPLSPFSPRGCTKKTPSSKRIHREVQILTR